jgi:hypothetical protein
MKDGEDSTSTSVDAPSSERKSKLSPEEVNELLEQSARGVHYLREQLRKVFRLPRRPMRLR